jgi:hypothetical protein
MGKSKRAEILKRKQEQYAESLPHQSSTDSYFERLLRAFAGCEELQDGLADINAVASNLMYIYAGAYRGSNNSRLPENRIEAFSTEYATLIDRYAKVKAKRAEVLEEAGLELARKLLIKEDEIDAFKEDVKRLFERFNVDTLSSNNMNGHLAADFRRTLQAAVERGELMERARIIAALERLGGDVDERIYEILGEAPERGVDADTRKRVAYAVKLLLTDHVYDNKFRLGAIGSQMIEDVITALGKVAPVETGEYKEELRARRAAKQETSEAVTAPKKPTRVAEKPAQMPAMSFAAKRLAERSKRG